MYNLYYRLQSDRKLYIPFKEKVDQIDFIVINI